MKRAIFLDRDGTLNVDVGYLHRLEDLELFPWTADAVRLLKRAGFVTVIVTSRLSFRWRARYVVESGALRSAVSI